MVSPRGEWDLHHCRGPHPPLLPYIHQELGVGHAGEWGGRVLLECTHMHTHTHNLPLLPVTH